MAVWKGDLLELAAKRAQEEKNLFFSSYFAVLFFLLFSFFSIAEMRKGLWKRKVCLP